MSFTPFSSLLPFVQGLVVGRDRRAAMGFLASVTLDVFLEALDQARIRLDIHGANRFSGAIHRFPGLGFDRESLNVVELARQVSTCYRGVQHPCNDRQSREIKIGQPSRLHPGGGLRWTGSSGAELAEDESLLLVKGANVNKERQGGRRFVDILWSRSVVVSSSKGCAPG
ncbi:hypothetical protein BJ170DRAFT_599922 [Xylariales sp. AK1849]|nr:hypothetical protein BJ170DRAFT_599922 [Xylariales sp. AK1849]